MVFDVKFDFSKKTRFIGGRNHTDTPREDIYLCVVGLMSVGIGYIIAAFNALNLCAADIGNEFLYEKPRDMVYIKAGREFGPKLMERPLIIDRVLLGLRSISARSNEHLFAKLRRTGYVPLLADTDFWIKDCGKHYEYIAKYVDDVLRFSKDPIAVIEEPRRDCVLKDVASPRYYLGGYVISLEGSNKELVYTELSTETYIGNLVSKFETTFHTPENNLHSDSTKYQWTHHIIPRQMNQNFLTQDDHQYTAD